MGKIQYGCQTYPWKMNQQKWAGNVPHMAQTIAQAGFTGMEAEICMLGDYFDHPRQVKEILDTQNLSLSALVLHQDWEHPQETEEERALTDKAIDFVKHFPFAKIMVSHHAYKERGTGQALQTERECLLSCMNSVANRAAEEGIVTMYHPNSSRFSLFRTREDYTVLFEMLHKSAVGYAPDVGHIVNGGMDAMEILKESRDLIRHVHFKDRSGPNAFEVMGEGSIDYPAIINYLADTGYRGWIMVEDESPKAVEDSDGVVMADGAYIAKYKR